MKNCVAAHIVPQSRPDVSDRHGTVQTVKISDLYSTQLYQKILNIKRRPNMFDASAGLLLETGLHKAFDRLDWSLYRKLIRLANQEREHMAHPLRVKDDAYYVHFFLPTDPEHFRLHGKAIPADRFGSFYDPPDPCLVPWHYSQAVKARIRGYSVQMNMKKR